MKCKLDKLKKFLVEAKKKTYASGDENLKKVQDDNSTTIIYKNGDWKYYDNYFGGKPYGDREVVFYKGKEVYMMVYYGYVNEKVKNVNNIYSILMGALKNIPGDYPYRGPKIFEEGEYIYQNEWEGQIDNFSGKEKILNEKGNILYQARYIGGKL